MRPARKSFAASALPLDLPLLLWRGRLARLTERVATLGALACGAAIGAGNVWPTAELAVHLTWQYALAVSVLGLVRITRGARGAGLLLLLLGAAACARTWTAYAPPAPTGAAAYAPQTSAFTLLQYNVRYTGATRDARLSDRAGKPQGIFAFLQAAIESRRPDVVLLQEATPAAEDAMRSITADYPWRALYPRKDAYGMLLYSKFPILSQRRELFTESNNRYTRLTLRVPGRDKPFTLWELHAGNPLHDGFKGRRRDKELTELAELIAQDRAALGDGAGTALIGDFNCTPFSPVFTRLEEETGLVSVSRGHFPSGTWPSQAPSPARIQIDHLLTTAAQAEHAQSEVLEDGGSDHMPVFRMIPLK